MTRFKCTLIGLFAFLFCFTISAKIPRPFNTDKDSEASMPVKKSQAFKKNEWAYTLCQNSNRITPFDLTTGQSGIPLFLKVCPKEMVIAPSGEKAYIIVDDLKQILSVSLTTGEISTSIDLKDTPHQMLVSNDGKTAYVACKDSSEIIAIDLHSEKTSVYAILESCPSRLHFDKEEKTIYISYADSPMMTRLNCESRIQTSLFFKEALQALALFPHEKIACVGTTCVNDVHVFALSSQQEQTHLTEEEVHFLLDKSIQHIHLSSDGSKAYLVHLEDNTITPLDLIHYKLGESILVDHEIQNIALYPNVLTGIEPSGLILVSSVNPVIFGQSITFTATLNTDFGIPTGTITFTDGATQLGTIPLDTNAEAVFDTADLSVGSHSITASYSGDDTFDISSFTLSQSVVATSTMTTVTSALNPSQFGDIVTFSAMVSGDLSTLPTGIVSFSDGATQIGTGTLDSNGIATFSTALLSVGTHSITAVYGGDPNFEGSISSGYTQTVAVASTSTGLTSSANPSVFGQSITFTATVSSPLITIPTGQVIFSDGATQIGMGILDENGVATFTTATLSTGTHSITAMYEGDATFDISNASCAQVINQALTHTLLSATPNPAVFGQSVTLTATLSVVSPGAGVLTGTVQFFDGSVNLGTANVINGVATLAYSSLSVGQHTILATYSGDINFISSTSIPWFQTVTQGTTSTSLIASQNPAPFGQAITFTANVSVTTGVGILSGTVSFFDGSTLIGIGTVLGGQATLITSTLTVGTHPVTAMYSGDTNFTSSTSPLLSQVITKASTHTQVASSANPSTYGQSIILTGTTTITSGAGTPTGSITFYDGPVMLGSSTINNSGIATFSVFNLSVGSHSITASYNGDNHFSTSLSPIVNQLVNQATPLIILSSSANPSNFGNLITYTGTVSAPTSLGLPSGTVAFYDGATLLGTGILVGSGTNTSTTTFAISTLFGGSHSVTAVYSGDTNFTTVISAPLAQVINKAASTSTIIFSNSPNPTEFGQVVSLRATITGSVFSPPQAPTGNIMFLEGTTVLGTVPVSQISLNTSTATLNISTLTTGSHSITAAYQGDVNYPNSTSLPMVQTVIKTSSATVLSTSTTPSKFGQSITITAIVTNNVSGTGNPTGNLQFYDSATLLGSGTLAPNGPNSSVATFTTSSLSLGSHSLIGFFYGDTNFTSSTSTPLTQTVIQDQTSTAVSSSLNPSSFGTSITFTAAVTANAPGSGIPTGTVKFFDGSASLGVVNLNAGSANLSTIALYPGTHPITAVYSGDTNFILSTSPALNQVVTNQLNTITTLSSGRNSSPVGQAVTFYASVTAITGIPTGTVTFSNNGIPFGTGTLVNGVASATDPDSDLALVGPYAITAVYNGDANFITSLSTPFTQYVVPLNTTTALTVSPNHSEQAGATLTATVSIIGGIGPLTGSVSFFEGSTLLTGTVDFNRITGVATLTPNNLHFGSTPIIAAYSGDQTTFAYSVSNVITQQVQQTDMLTTDVILTASPLNGYECQPLMLTATVIATQGFYTPTGSVTFFDNNVEIGTALLNSSGIATLSLSSLPIGTHPITATYNSDSNYAFSSANTLSVNISTNPTNTVFTIIPVLSTTPYGQNLIFVAKTTALYAIPTGTMTFSTATETLVTLPLDEMGQATLQTSILPVGTEMITATYNPMNCFTSSVATITHTVSPSNPTTSLSSTPQPSGYGQPITLTGFLSSPTFGEAPTGTVTFFNGSTSLGTVPIIEGGASLTVSGLPAGIQILKAVYSGDSNFTATTFPSLIQTINQATTLTSLLNFSSNPSASGEPLTFEAIVTSLQGVPTGTVTFNNGSTILGIVPLNGAGLATLRLSNLNLGTNAITANYNGDSNFAASLSDVYSQVVSKAATNTTIVSSTPNPSVVGNLVTFNIAVDAVYPATGTPTGSVTGYLGSTILGTSPLTNGIASFSTSSLPVGTQTILVIYSADANFNASNAVSTQTVQLANSSTTLVSTTNPSAFGQSITFSATVNSSLGIPAGRISFLDGTTTLATQTLNSSGLASFTLSNLTIGTHAITAIYSGSASLAPSTSSVISQVINKAATATLLTSLNDPSFYGETIIFQAYVSAVSPGAGIPSGTVTFFNGTTNIGTGTLDSSGRTSFTLPSLFASSTPYAITSSYNGNASYTASTSLPINQTVNKAATLTSVSYAPNPSSLEIPVTLNVTVIPVNTGSGIPSGNVSILYGSEVVGSGIL